MTEPHVIVTVRVEDLLGFPFRCVARLPLDAPRRCLATAYLRVGWSDEDWYGAAACSDADHVAAVVALVREAR